MKIRNLDSVKDLNKISNLSIETKVKVLRQLRQKECFNIINRGDLWYKRLTEGQKIELDSWYQAWLDVTVTLIIPTKPLWL